MLVIREVFLDFDPVSVSKLNEKKVTAPGSPAISLLSESKLRAILENARQMCKVVTSSPCSVVIISLPYVANSTLRVFLCDFQISSSGATFLTLWPLLRNSLPIIQPFFCVESSIMKLQAAIY